MTTGTFFGWLLHVSWQAGVLAIIVLALQWALQKKLSAAWRHALWLLVVARLALPVSPRSAVSLFNFARVEKSAPASVTAVTAEPVAAISRAGDRVERAYVAAPSEADAQPATIVPLRDLPVRKVAQASPSVISSKSGAWMRAKDIPKICAVVWMIGVAVLGFRIVAQNVIFARRLRDRRPITDAQIVGLFERCKELFGLRFPIRLLATNAVTSPALYGWWRPSLLLPPGMLPRFSREELRYVFLHELAHVKRRDMGVHWLATVLGVLHWFNPVLWFAFRRMAADRELACDELALGRAGEAERRPYGETILKLLESCARPAVLPGLMGLLEDKDQMTRRITMIAKFRKHRRWSVLAIPLMMGLAFATLTDAREEKKEGTKRTEAAQAVTAEDGDTNAVQQPRPDLTGHVKTKAGDVLPKATVFIATAGPKVGSSTFCPSCYADCRKSAKTDGEGGFKIESLDPQLIFRILVASPGYKPKYVAKIDPASGPVNVTLEPVEAAEAASDRSVRGRIVDPSGKPIYGAVVEAHGIRRKNDVGTMWGTLPGVDPLAVTDEKGEFLLTAREPFESLDLRVEARAFANRNFTRVSAGNEVHPLTMTEGTTVTGRVMQNGKPLPGVSVGLVSAQRDMENYTGNFEIGTDKTGRFSFVNLPPDVNYLVYGMMNSIKPYGAISARSIQALGDGKTLEVGDLVPVPAQRLAGQVVLADGKSVPAKTRLLVSRSGAWDSIQLTLDNEGRFDTTCSPKETINLSARVTGYHLSARNRSLDRLNPFQLVGRVEGDVTNLMILMEKGKEVQPDYNANYPEAAWPQNRPLHGAEGTSDHSDQIVVSGQVQDRDSKKPLDEFRVTAGNNQSGYRQTFWDKRSTVDGTNGSFTVYVDKKFGDPLLKIEAEGHLPRSVSVLPESRSNLVFTLEKGAGPSGTVLLPDGQPAQGVSVALLCAHQDNPRLAADGRLRSYRNKDAIQVTDPEGNFSFAPELDMESVAVSAKAGFKMVTMQELAASPRLTLEPWGRIKGVINRGSGKGTNEVLDLAFKDQSDYFIENHVTTDSEGRFEFEQVPPGRLFIHGRNMMGNNGWTSEKLDSVVVKPGETSEVSIHAPVRTKGRGDLGGGVIMAAPEKPKPVQVSGPPIEGTVLLPDGKPAVDMDVALKVPGKYLALARGSLKAYQTRQEGLVVHADSTGHFSLPGVADATGVVMADERGFAEVSLSELKKNPQVTLQAWGRIEGVLRVGRALGTNQQVSLAPAAFQQAGMVFDVTDFRARTDDQGRFIITYVPPGERKIARMIPTGEHSWSYSVGTLVNVKAGGVTEVSVGGTGRTVIGKARLTDASLEMNWKQAHAVLHTPWPPSRIKDQQARSNAWAQSSEAQAFMKTNQAFAVSLDTDGSFRAEEVPPGKYELFITFIPEQTRFRDGELPSELEKQFRGFQQEVVVPEFQSKDDDSPIDLGILEVKLRPLKELHRLR